MIRTHFAIALATISIPLISTPAQATDTTIIAYARMERMPPDFTHRDITPEPVPTECATPQEDMECTTGH